MKFGPFATKLKMQQQRNNKQNNSMKYKEKKYKFTNFPCCWKFAPPVLRLPTVRLQGRG
jgi:hypothetical protein